MKCVIISEKKVIDLGKRCLSNLRDFVNNESYLGYNDVKRLRTLFFMSCQMVFSEQLKSKGGYIKFEKMYEEYEERNEKWNEKFEEKFLEVINYVKKSKAGDKESKVEEVFNTPVWEKYSTEKFSLEEIDRIFKLVKDGLDRCCEIDEDLYYEIKDFKIIYQVYNSCYKSLDRD